jgi:oligopeptide transport system substrate-binding protein
MDSRPRRTRRVGTRGRGLIAGIAGLLAISGLLLAAPGARVSGAPRATRIAMSAPQTIDPAKAGDAGSAAVIAQLFEGLTAIDGSLTPRPALAAGWAFSDGNRTLNFTLRDGLTFSDGAPLTGADVVRSWLRVIDPASPSPLASLLFDVVGVEDYVAGRSSDPTAVGFSAVANTVTVHFTHPTGDFPAIAASPTLAVVPPGVGRDPAALQPGTSFVASGGYVLADLSPTQFTLTGNPHYWAGFPAIFDIEVVTDLGGKSPVDQFLADNLDWTPVGSYDASWIAYDRELGPDLRSSADLAVTYYGFDTQRPPFNDIRVRRAFAEAVDWKRIVQLADGSQALPATSIVPPGIPGRSETDFLPNFDPAAAKQLLAAAGYADPATFPSVTLATAGTGYDDAVIAQLKQNLGVTVKYETYDFSTFMQRLGAADGPQLWALSWVADYPSPYDFLGLLLGSNQPNNYGRWSNAAFDAALTGASSTTDGAAARGAYDQAQALVREEVPVVPVSYSSSDALSRAGLLGATMNGMGILRFAGLAWAPGAP